MSSGSATAGLVDEPLAARPRPAAVRLAPPARYGGSPLLRACRPRQWLKNSVVLIAPAAAGALTRPQALPALLGAFVSFCLISSATYLINDVHDRHEDRRHPRKRFRPVAAGQLAPAAALRAALVLGLAAVGLALLVRPPLAAVVVGYAALTFSYTLLWRNVVLLDVVVVAVGFVFRAVAGAAAVPVAPSRSFLVVTSACALFLIVGKRYAELVTPHRRSAARATLGRYSRRSLRLLLTGSALLGCFAYGSWALGRAGEGPWLTLSLLPFVLGLGRYAALVRQGHGESPEAVVLGDSALLTLGLVWTALFAAGIYVPG